MNTRQLQDVRFRTANPKRCWGKEDEIFARISTARTKIVKVNDGDKILGKEELNFAIPGLNHVLDSSKGFVFKILWLIVIISSFALCVYQIYDRFSFYLSYPIDTRITILRNETVKFPSLTICAPTNGHVSLIPVLRSIAKKRNVPICNLTTAGLIAELNLTSFWRLINTEGLFFQVGVLSRLSYINTQITNDVTNVSVLTTYGNCTTFSIKKLVPFQLEDYAMYAGFNYPPKEIACNMGSMIALYFVHLDDEDVTYKFSRGYAVLSKKMSVIVGLKAKQFRAINRTESPCDSTAVVSQCERKCFEDYIKKHIPCGLPFMSLDDKALCKNGNQAVSTLLNVYELMMWFRYAKKCSCPSICDEIMYSKNLKQFSESRLSSLQYIFEDDVVEDIEEYYSYTAIPFICDVGGNLGLFLGLCIPAIIDTLQSVIVFVFTKITLHLEIN